MIKRVLLILFLMGISGCWYGPAVNSTYDFEKVGIIYIDAVRDHSNLSGSGKMVQTSLTHNFLKYGFGVTESDLSGPVVNVGNGDQSLKLSCIITEFTDSKVIVVPYRHEDRGYTKTIVDQSSEADAGNEKAETSASTTTTTHGTPRRHHGEPHTTEHPRAPRNRRTQAPPSGTDITARNGPRPTIRLLLRSLKPDTRRRVDSREPSTSAARSTE